VISKPYDSLLWKALTTMENFTKILYGSMRVTNILNFKLDLRTHTEQSIFMHALHFNIVMDDAVTVGPSLEVLKGGLVKKGRKRLKE
jgi:hypothetical protein